MPDGIMGSTLYYVTCHKLLFCYGHAHWLIRMGRRQIFPRTLSTVLPRTRSLRLTEHAHWRTRTGRRNIFPRTMSPRLRRVGGKS